MNKIIGNPFDIAYRIIIKEDIVNILVDSMKCIIDINKLLIQINKVTGENKESITDYNIKLFCYGRLVPGASENENEPLWFGELNNDELDSSKPIYRLLGDKDNESQLLRVYIGNNTMLIRNYSILDSSLGIKLEVKSEEAKYRLEKEQKKREQKQQSNSSLLSTSMLCPVLEDDILMCPHGGQVQLKSNKGKPFKSNGVPLILEPDLINAPISGCSNNILGVPTPCTTVAVIPPAALSMKKFNGEKAVMQDYASMIMTDKGVPLQCIPKPNKWKLLTAVPTGSGDGKESKESVEQKSHILLLRYNMLNTDKVQVISSSYENRENAKFNKVINLSEISVDNPLELDYTKLDEDDEGILDYIYDLFSQKYLREHYTYKLLTVVINYSINEYVLLIPKGKPKLLKSLPKEKQPYGMGRFIDMVEPYGRMVSDNFGNDKYVNYLSITGNVFKTGIGMEKLRLVVG